MDTFRKVWLPLAMMLVCIMSSGRVLAVDLAKIPLFIEGNVPGNLALVPSVEYPTVISVANLGNYDESKSYTGYFDSEKCYQYNYSSDEEQRRFYPSSTTSDHRCSGGGEWSGNFLSWAATQTIDPFRLVLTGGYRVKDTPTETWLEKARHNRGDLYPDRAIYGQNLVQGATPYSGDSFHVRIAGQESGMLFRVGSGDFSDRNDFCDYGSDYWGCDIRRASVRVKVCDANVGVESFCTEYDRGWKPEGLIQEYAEDVRFSIFGYLNDSDMYRDGGVLRAPMKYVGPRKLTEDGWLNNAVREWDPDTGVFVRNPDGASSALGISISDSGVINYLNKFGQLNDNEFKSHDPVSELYYTAYRYFSNLGPVDEYTDRDGANVHARRQWVDNFPVYEEWDDPIEYSCQKNVILGIGDANTHRDKNLPGNSTYKNDEPNTPSEVGADNTVNVVAETNRVGRLEGLGNIGSTNSFSGRNNSAYIAGLAYRAHTRDIRDADGDLSGDQTIETHWVDVLENQYLEPVSRNQYYLAAKYGGFDISESFDPENPSAADIEEKNWHTTGEKIYPGDQGNISGSGIRRPDNYYLAGKAESMVDSLDEAFKSIVEDVKSSSASIAANSTRLDTESLIYQAVFNSNTWHGDLVAYNLDDEGDVEATSAWKAADKLDALSNQNVITSNTSSDALPRRRIYTMNPVTNTRADFLWGQLTTAQKESLNSSDGLGADRLDYLRGDTSKELENGGVFRDRVSRLGDIVNSNPAYSGREGYGFQLLGNTAGEKYPAYLEEKRSRREMIYVGGNDGMLHAFDAKTGREVFAYVPDLLMDKLPLLTSTGYTHDYFVDGSPIVTDVYDGGSWKTVLIGTLGAGGKGIFALDVSNPDDPEVLWEFTHEQLGEGVSQVSVIPVDDDAESWVVAFGNGYNSDLGRAALMLVDLETGDLVGNAPIYVGPEENGLAGVTAISSDNDYIADTIYAGDLHGNLWKFVSKGSGWGSAFGGKNNPGPLFQARTASGDVQPITSRPEVSMTEDDEIIVLFGTGKYMELSDIHDKTVQSAYGILDRDSEVSGRGDLVGQSITDQGETTVDNETVPYRVVSSNALGSEEGWYLDLVPPGGNEEGERIIVRPVLRGDAVVLTTLIPSSSPCGGGGSSWVMAVNKGNGGQIEGGIFDVNNDGVIDENDYVNGGTVPISGIGSTNIVTRPSFMSGPGNIDIGFASDSSGDVVRFNIKGLGAGPGRQSWRQLR